MDGTRITAARTGAAAAVAAGAWPAGRGRAGHPRRRRPGPLPLDAFPLVRDFREIRVASRDPVMRPPWPSGLAARAVGSFEEAVAGADVVACCTDARQPVLEAGWLAPGAHVSSVGGTFGPELDRPSPAPAGCSSSGAAPPQPAPGRRPRAPGPRPRGLTEIGEVLAGTRPGRTGADELTVYKSTGHAVEDAAAADLVYRRALESGTGVRVVV